jgi:3-deoxy-7-phosphoheptulonate synthase
VTDLGLPVATEMLDPISPEYLADLLSWGAIGARTTESQTHRELASGLSFPIGFKNGTDGNLQIAIDAMKAALHSHCFLGVNRDGLTSIVHTSGNPDVHMVLRGGSKPNYSPADIAKAEEMLAKAGLTPTVMVDCSHGNSEKNYERQPQVMRSVVEQIEAGNRSISGVMIESYLKGGNQPMKDPATLAYGVSITDSCISWETTEQTLREAHARLKACGGRRLS